MNGIYTQKRSPYYWLRYYDRTEPDPKKRRKSLNTKIPITEGDKKRIEAGEPIKGNYSTKLLSEEFNKKLAKINIERQTGVTFDIETYLSEGLKRYLLYRSVPGTEHQLKPKTIQIYQEAVKHIIKCSGDKVISQYNDIDFNKLLFFYEEKGLSQNTRSIYTRSLKTIWNYFVKNNLAYKNIIEKVKSLDKEPEPIPLDDMRTILEYFKSDEEHPYHYHFIYFMFLTGCRPSSAIVQLKELIDTTRNIIQIKNVKAGDKKRNRREYYNFPLYNELKHLLIDQMSINKNSKGRLFPQYGYNDLSYTQSLKFWNRGIRTLLKKGEIKKNYSLKQIRPTTAYYLINELKLSIYTVQQLLDHSTVEITKKHYATLSLDITRDELKHLNIFDINIIKDSV